MKKYFQNVRFKRKKSDFWAINFKKSECFILGKIKLWKKERGREKVRNRKWENQMGVGKVKRAEEENWVKKYQILKHFLGEKSTKREEKKWRKNNFKVKRHQILIIKKNN